MSQTFFVLSGQQVDLARDEVISISKSYNPKLNTWLESRLLILESKVSWKKVAGRATFVRFSGNITGTFDDISKIDLPVSEPETFVCKTINLSSKIRFIFRTTSRSSPQSTLEV
jgi:tRNA (guanine10-N2)-dimethyltransferase